MIFFIAVTTITLMLCALTFYPLLKKGQNTNTQQRDNLNKSFYFNRLQEVKNEIAEGKIDDFEQTKQELQQSLLDDIPETVNQPEQTKTANKKFVALFIGLIISVSTISTTVYWHIGSWREQTMFTTNHQKLTYFYERITSEENEPLSETELKQFVMALRNDLQHNPQDDRGWFMLGQLGIALDDGQLALDSFAKANQLQPENTQYKLRYAQILLFSADIKDKEQGENLLKEVIRTDHTNTEALSLLAFNAFEKEDYKMAAMTWGMMLKLIPENDPRRATIERSMQSARSMAEQQNKQ